MYFLKKFVFIIAIFMVVALCACSVQSEDEPDLIRAEKEAEYYRSLEDNKIDQDNMKSIGSEDLDSLDFESCSVAVLDNYGIKIYEHLSDKDTEEFIECITNAELSTEEYEVPEKNGYAPYRFRITLSTGEQIYIAPISSDDNHLLVINGEHGYLCDIESIDKINGLYHNAYKRFSESAMNG